jgi:hypothetical protein
MHEKVLLPAETVRLLEVCGVIKPNPW